MLDNLVEDIYLKDYWTVKQVAAMKKELGITDEFTPERFKKFLDSIVVNDKRLTTWLQRNVDKYITEFGQRPTHIIMYRGFKHYLQLVSDMDSWLKLAGLKVIFTDRVVISIV